MMAHAITQPIPKSRSPHHLWSDQKLLLGLFHGMIPDIRKTSGKASTSDASDWTYESTMLIQKTLASCTRVCHEWNRVFTPLLYKSIVIGKTRSTDTDKYLRQVGPANKVFITTIRVEAAEDVSPANVLFGLISGLPNLHELTLDGLLLSKCHRRFPQLIHSLSRKCMVKLRYTQEHGGGRVRWEILPNWITSIQQSRVAHCELEMDHCSSDSKYQFLGAVHSTKS